MTKPVLLVGMDGWSQTIAEALMAQGRLPTFARLRREGAVAALVHGDAWRTGLAWEHVATGRSPDDARRWSAVDFDVDRYRAENKTTRQRPFAADLPVSTVVFDAPYFDLPRSDMLTGLVNWGAHDPGVPPFARPDGLEQELLARFGPYPAIRYIYGEVWHDRDKARAMAEALVAAVSVRTEATEWLLAERLPGWDFAFVVISEFHSAAEAMFHGWDESHPLHGLPGTADARDGIVGVYEAADRMIARLLARFPEARFVACNLHEMGPNGSDVASMALLPELMYRIHFGKPLMRDHPVDAKGHAVAPRKRDWSGEVTRLLPREPLIRRIVARATGRREPPEPMSWMPAVRYQPYWRQMEAFALPSFYDGRIRVNLAGRERNGTVSLDDYAACLDGLERVLRDCRNVHRDDPVIAAIERNPRPPLELEPSEADLMIVWSGAPLGLVHPRHGRIGPLPYRRPGGHGGADGAAYFHGEGIGPVKGLRFSAFDLAPTVVEMLGQSPQGLSGASFASRILR